MRAKPIALPDRKRDICVSGVRQSGETLHGWNAYDGGLRRLNWPEGQVRPHACGRIRPLPMLGCCRALDKARVQTDLVAQLRQRVIRHYGGYALAGAMKRPGVGLTRRWTKSGLRLSSHLSTAGK